MTEFLEWVMAGFEPTVFFTLLASSFVGSFVTVALGIGGGVLLLAMMASLMPPAALIPVHGVIQVGSNVLRAAIMHKHVFWPPFAAFAFGTAVGVAVGGMLVVRLPPPVVQISVGVFVIWSVLYRPPRWLSVYPGITGGISSFLTMFFGATGVFVANFTKSLNLSRQPHVATHAVMMTLQHFLKICAFWVLGFAFAPWLGFIVAMIVTGFLGTLVGRQFLNRITDFGFKRALNIVLLLISLRLIWMGLAALI